MPTNAPTAGSASGAFTATVDGRGETEPGSSRVVVPWWSFSKTLIAVCALRLAERGRIALDAPVAGAPYTPRQLLQHRAGLPDYGRLGAYHEAVARGQTPWPAAELLARTDADRLLFAPGTGWAYSNVGYFIARRLIERACDAALPEAMHTLVLAPLGLRDCRVAVTRDDMHSTAFQGGHGYDPGWVFHGTVIGPVAEAALALHRLLGGSLLAPSSRAAMVNRHAIGGALAGRPWLTAGYGLGLMMGAMQSEATPEPVDVAGHTAGGPGSVGAVYRRAAGRTMSRTAAVFTTGKDEGVPEYEALRRLAAA